MGRMKIIQPTVIGDAMLVSSTVLEPDSGEVLWNAETPYAVDATVIRTTTHRKYERRIAGTSATAPENDTVNWLDVGPTNRWAMLDRKIGTSTEAPTSLTVKLRPGGVSGVGVLEIVGRELNVTLRDAPGGNVVYTKAVVLDGTLISSVYDWLFEDYEQLTDIVLTDLPQHYTSGELTFSLTGTAGVSLGVLHVGRVMEIGQSLYGASVGMLDFSKKSRDVFGNVDVLERSYSKRMSLQVITDKVDFNKIFRRLAALRATPCIYIGADEIGYEPMINYGFYKDFGIVVSYPQHHLLNIEIEGIN